MSRRCARYWEQLPAARESSFNETVQSGEMRMVRVDPRHLAQEAALRERRYRVYLLVIGTIIVLVAVGLIWLTW